MVIEIIAVKKNIEDVQGKDNYPCDQQLLIHNGKVLKDESTLAENKVSEDGFLVVMLTKSKTSGSSGVTSSQPAPVAASAPNPTSALDAQPPALAPRSSEPASVAPTTNDPSEPCAQAASNVVAGDNLERIIQQLIDMGGGSWDKETVIRALRAAYNNPERAVDYLYSGIPESTEVAVPSAQPAVDSLTASGAANAPPTSGAPNSSPLDLFPQETIDGAGLGSLDFLGNNEQGDEDMPHAVSVTPAEEAAIERMEAMGFDRALVIEAFLACDRNEELALNYLLENAADFE
ncbi:UNVERIFIED_CONTAM: Ubiquitin receptor b [Sesamum angustifolium]|uniref:Ubiquitin receptor RAD23 n=1 Tax=Sesamum angustifolium TaxID=2727405 RepID=A0AAW2LJZ0_9LAMI